MYSDRPGVRPLPAAIRAACDAWRMEALEPRLLLSADPLVAGLAALAPDPGSDGPAAYAAGQAPMSDPAAYAAGPVPLSDPPVILSTDLVAATGNVDLTESVRISGDVRIEATIGSVRVGNENTDYLGGHSAATTDTLLVVAAADVRFYGAVGDGTAASDALNGLTVQAGDDVTFDREVVVNGDLVIDAGGVVTFNDRITLRNGGELTITGATQIVLKGAVALQLGLSPTAGDVLLEGDEIDLTMGSELFSGSGTVTLRPATLAAPIALLSPAGALTSGVLNLETAELRAFADGFAGFVIGHQGLDGHAAAGAGAVTIGANTVLDGLSFFDPAAIYGGSIAVADYSNPSAMLRLGEGDALTLEATGNITIANEIETDALNLVSTGGAISQVDALADDLGAEAVRTLALSATAVAGISLPSVEAATIEAHNDGSGDIDIGVNAARSTTRFDDTAITGSAELLGLSQDDAGGDGGISVTSVAGSLTLAAAGSGVTIAGTGPLTLAAGGDGSDLAIDAPIAVVSGAVALSAADALSTGAGGTITASGAADITLSAGTGDLAIGAAITTAGGTVGFVSGGALDFSGITLSAGPGGSLSLEAAGDLVVGIIEADVAITLTSTGGAIVDGLAGDDANLRGDAATATLNAANGVGSGGAALRTMVGALEAGTTAGGGIFILEDTALTVTGLATAGSGAGAIVVQTTTGALAVTGAVGAQADGGGNVLLQALDGDVDVQAEVAALGGSLSLIASQAMALQGASTFDVRTGGATQTLDLRAGGALTMGGDVRLQSQGGAVRVLAGGALALGRVDAAGGDVELEAGGALSLAADADADPDLLDVDAGTLRASAGGDLGDAARALRTSASTIAAMAGGGAWLAADGDTAIGSLGGVAVDAVAADGSAATATASATLAGLDAGGVAVLDAGGTLAVDAAVSAGSHLRLSSAGAMTVAAGVSTVDGHLSLVAGGDLAADAAGDLSAGGSGVLDVEAGGTLTAADGQQAVTAGGDARLVAGGAMTLGTVDAGTGDVSLHAASLAAAAAAGPDIVGAALRVVTDGGDAGSAGRALALQVDTLAGSVAGAFFAADDGDLAVVALAAADALRVGLDGSPTTLSDADAAVAGLTTGGTLVLAAGGAIDVAADAPLAAGGTLRLDAGGVLSLAGATTAAGAATLLAGDAMQVDATLAAASLDVSAGGDLTMGAGVGASAALQRWSAGGDLAVGRLDAGADGAIALVAAGDLTDAQADADVDVTGGQLWLAAGGDVGASGNALDTAAVTLAASAGGALFVAEADALAVGTVSVAAQRVAADGSVAAITADGGSGVVTAGALVLGNADGDLDVAAAVDSGGGPLRLAAAGALALGAGVASGGGALTLVAGGAMAFAADVSVDSDGGAVDAEAGGDLAMAAGSRLASGGGDLRAAAGGGLTVSVIDAGSGGASVFAAAIADLADDADDPDLVAATLHLAATAGDLGSAADPLELAVGTLSASAAGDTLSLHDSGGVIVAAPAAMARQRVAEDGSVEAPAGDAATGGLVGAGFVALASDGSLAIDAAVVAGGALRLAADGADAALTSSATIDAGGAMTLLAGGDLTVGAALSAGGSLAAEAGGALVLAAAATVADADAWLSAGGAMTLQSMDLGSGRLAIVAASLSDDDGGADTRLRAGAIRIDVDGAAGSGADPIEISTTTLALRSVGGAYVTDDDGLRLGAVTVAATRLAADGTSSAIALDALAGLQAGGRAVVIAETGALSLDAVSAVGSARLQAVAGGLTLNAALGAAGPLSLIAGGDIAMAAAGDVAVAGAASVDVSAGGSLSMADDARIVSGSGVVRLEAVANLSLGSVATAGGVSLLARTISDAGTSDLDIAAASLRVLTTGVGTTQGFGSGSKAIQMQVATLAANVAGTGAGGFFGVEADGLHVGRVGAMSVSRVGADGGDVSVTDSALADLVSAGNLILQSTTGDLVVDDGDDDGLGLSAGGNLRLQAIAGDIATASATAVRSTSGHATLLASGDIALGGDLALERSGRTIDVEAGGDLRLAAGTTVSTVNSDLRLSAGGDLALDRITAGSGRVSLIAGDIAEADADAETDVTASALRMVSGDGIGSEADRLEVKVGTVSARAAGGGIWLEESDAIRIADVAATVQRVGVAGTVTAVADAAQSDLVTTGGNGDIAVRTLNGDIDLLDGSAPADGQSITPHGSGRVLLDIQGDGALLDVGGGGFVQQGPVEIGSDLRVQGAFVVTAGDGGTDGDGGIAIDGAIDGNTGGDADTVVLHADGAVTITGPIGATTPLAGLTIDGATDVTLAGPLTLTGDTVIEATGIVHIGGSVDLGGGTLRIVGATQVIVDGPVTGGAVEIVAGGDVDVAGALTAAHGLNVVAAGILRVDGDAFSGDGDLVLAVNGLDFGGRIVGAADATMRLSAADGGSIAYGGGSGDLVFGADWLARLEGFDALQVGDADSASVRMAAGSALDSGGRPLTLQADGDIAVSSIDAGDSGVVLDSASGTIAESGVDAAVDVTAAWVMMRGHGPALAAGASVADTAIEVGSARVDIDGGGGFVLRDSAPDGSVRYNLLADGVLYQQLQAGADVVREGSGAGGITPSEVEGRVLALRAGDAGDGFGIEGRRHALAWSASPASPSTEAQLVHLGATPEAGGWLAQRLAASSLLVHGDTVAAAVLPPLRVEYWTDPLEL